MAPTLALTAPLAARHTRLSDLAFELLAQAIVDDRLAPGQPLRDYALAEQLGVSRTPVREALQRLERAGLVETMASRSTRVAEIGPETIANAIEYAGYAYGSSMRVAVQRMDDMTHAAVLALVDRLVSAHEVGDLVDAARELFAYVCTQEYNHVFLLRSDLRFLVDRAMNDLPANVVLQRINATRDQLHVAVDGRDADQAELAVRRMHGIT